MATYNDGWMNPTFIRRLKTRETITKSIYHIINFINETLWQAKVRVNGAIHNSHVARLIN